LCGLGAEELTRNPPGVVTGSGTSPDGSRWIASRPDYLVPVAILSALFRGRMLGMLIDAHSTIEMLAELRWRQGPTDCSLRLAG
jgi:hypothetical protein